MTERKMPLTAGTWEGSSGRGSQVFQENTMPWFVEISWLRSFQEISYSCSFQTSAPSPVSFSTIRS